MDGKSGIQSPAISLTVPMIPSGLSEPIPISKHTPMEPSMSPRKGWQKLFTALPAGFVEGSCPNEKPSKSRMQTQPRRELSVSHASGTSSGGTGASSSCLSEVFAVFATASWMAIERSNSAIEKLIAFIILD